MVLKNLDLDFGNTKAVAFLGKRRIFKKFFMKDKYKMLCKELVAWYHTKIDEFPKRDINNIIDDMEKLLKQEGEAVTLADNLIVSSD